MNGASWGTSRPKPASNSCTISAVTAPPDCPRSLPRRPRATPPERRAVGHSTCVLRLYQTAPFWRIADRKRPIGRNRDRRSREAHSGKKAGRCFLNQARQRSCG